MKTYLHGAPVKTAAPSFSDASVAVSRDVVLNLLRSARPADGGVWRLVGVSTVSALSVESLRGALLAPLVGEVAREAAQSVVDCFSVDESELAVRLADPQGAWEFMVENCSENPLLVDFAEVLPAAAPAGFAAAFRAAGAELVAEADVAEADEEAARERSAAGALVAAELAAAAAASVPAGDPAAEGAAAVAADDAARVAAGAAPAVTLDGVYSLGGGCYRLEAYGRGIVRVTARHNGVAWLVSVVSSTIKDASVVAAVVALFREQEGMGPDPAPAAAPAPAADPGPWLVTADDVVSLPRTLLADLVRYAAMSEFGGYAVARGRAVLRGEKA